MHPTLERLLASGPVVTDGASGTELQARGLVLGEFPDLWNLRYPDRVLEVARAYIEAGSQMILTNTFGANRVRLAEQEPGTDLGEINRLGVLISRQAAADRATVFGSMGPSGKMLLTGDVSEKDLTMAFTEQAEALASAGAGGLVVETMTDLEEAALAVRAAHATGLPVVACVVFDSGKNLDRTMMGAHPEQVAERLLEAGADVVGTNCGRGIDGMETLCRRLHQAAGGPVWIKPNAGLPRLQEGRAVYAATPETFAAHVPALVAAGALFIGGCCGTNPAFIRELNNRVKELRRRGQS